MHKEHNTDYLSDGSGGILKLEYMANVAPEFGVRNFIVYKYIKKFNLKNYLNRFLEISYNSKKWKKCHK